MGDRGMLMGAPWRRVNVAGRSYRRPRPGL